jgi:hypothetical protein
VKKDVRIETYMEPSSHPDGGTRYRTELEVGGQRFVVSEIHTTGKGGVMGELHEVLAFNADENWTCPDMNEVTGFKSWAPDELLTPACISMLIDKISEKEYGD